MRGHATEIVRSPSGGRFSREPQNPSRPKRAKHWLLVSLSILAVILALIAMVLTRNWPFTRERLVNELQQVTSSELQIGSFKQTYFPIPGCIAERVTFRRNRDLRDTPLITIQKLTIQGSFAGLLAKHVPVIRADGAHVVIPPLGTGGGWAIRRSASNIVIGELVANGAVLEFTPRDPGKRRLKFEIRHFTLRDLGGNGPMAFETTLSNPEPPGEISASGSLGPWGKNDPTQTPISGSYSFRRANLGVFKGIAGTLSSDGKFEGDLKHLHVEGATDVPDFEVTRSSHKVHLTTQFDALVNATNGDVALQNVIAQFGGSTIIANGTIEGTGDKGKAAVIELVVREGRIQDILLLFIKSPRSPMTGVADFTGKATIPPGEGPFLQKVELQGDFGIGAGRFTSSKTQATVDKLSGQAQGEGGKGEKGNEDPETALSDLQGHVSLKDGTATFSSLSFRVPGALARLHGTYNVVNQRIDLRGTLLMQAKLSQATSGVKSFLLKVLDPLLKKNHRGGAKMPVSITGTYSRPSYRSDPI
jgi:AsmA-like C-terminal region